MIDKDMNCMFRYIVKHWWYPRFIGETFSRLIHGIKYAWQRINEGICDTDVWNLDFYISKVIVDGLRRLAKTAHGYPTEFGSFENWAKWLNDTADMIDQGINFNEENAEFFDSWTTDELIKKETESYKTWKEGLYRVADYIGNLWD